MSNLFNSAFNYFSMFLEGAFGHSWTRTLNISDGSVQSFLNANAYVISLLAWSFYYFRMACVCWYFCLKVHKLYFTSQRQGKMYFLTQCDLTKTKYGDVFEFLSAYHKSAFGKFPNSTLFSLSRTICRLNSYLQHTLFPLPSYIKLCPSKTYKYFCLIKRRICFFLFKV